MAEEIKILRDECEHEYRDRIISIVIDKNINQIKQYIDGKLGVLGFILGEVMSASRGRISPIEASEIIKNILIDKKLWVQIYNGHKFFPLSPHIKDVHICDIAHSLSQICRFNGHSNNFYSIAEHSIYVSNFCSKDDRLEGLLHDATEFIICDVNSGLKKTKEFEFYRKIEKNIDRCIRERFSLPKQESPEVKEIDSQILYYEAKFLMDNKLLNEWTFNFKEINKDMEEFFNPKEEWITYTPKVAKELFLELFVLYGGKWCCNECEDIYNGKIKK